MQFNKVFIEDGNSNLLEINSIGLEARSKNATFFFGNRNSSIDNIKKKYSAFDFLRIKQVHGDVVVQASNTIIEADAHFTLSNGQGLVIATADCAPILIYDPIKNISAAIHAGWRGVVNQITMKAIQKLIQLGSQSENLIVAIGPHIQYQSFEVETDVAKTLFNSIPPDFRNEFEYSTIAREKSFSDLKNDKVIVNLNNILQAQILSLGVTKNNLHVLKTDTKTDLLWHSYRRDKESSGRNLSFIGVANY